MKKFFPRLLREPKLQCYCRTYCIKRRKPTDPSLAESLPTFKYPTAKPNDRRIYAWGLADTGALGLEVANLNKDVHNPDNYHIIKQPRRHPFGEDHEVWDVAAGYGFSLFAIKSKSTFKVYGTGLNTDSQIGYHTMRLKPLEILFLPKPIHIPFKQPETTKIKSVAAGRAHTVIITDNEGTFSLGNNSYGQCGRKIIPNEKYYESSTIHRLPKLNDDKLIEACCGQDHTMLISESGAVYTCGWGADGQLGRGNFETDFILEKATGDIKNEKIVKLSCAADCILALNDKGEVFGWGNTEYGQITFTFDKEHQINKPRLLKLNLGKIIDIAAGGSFCAVLTENGDVFVWGFGILGLGPEANYVSEPKRIPPTLFGRNEFNPSSRVTQLNAGIHHMVAVSNDGDLYSWGKNTHACLGLGFEKDQYFPMKCAIAGQVIKVSCGVDHTVALCKPFV